MLPSNIAEKASGQLLTRYFFQKRPDHVALELLGTTIRRGQIICIIVETEAYFGDCDPGSRASKYKKGRIRSRLFGDPGVLLIYGMHGWLLTNIVAHEEGSGGAVLIRSCYVPGQGVIEGPGKVSRYLQVNPSMDGEAVNTPSTFMLYKTYTPKEVMRLYRVNVARDFKEPMRFVFNGLFQPRRYKPKELVEFNPC